MATNRTLLLGAGAGAAVVALVIALTVREGSPPKNTPAPVESPGSAEPPPRPIASAPPPSTASTEAAGDAGPIASGAPVDLGMALIAANRVNSAKAALAAGDPRKALADIESYQKLPEANALKEEAVVIKIEALSKIPGRKTDALTLAMSTRDDPSYASYQPQIRALLQDAGVLPPPPAPVP